MLEEVELTLQIEWTLKVYLIIQSCQCVKLKKFKKILEFRPLYVCDPAYLTNYKRRVQ